MRRASGDSHGDDSVSPSRPSREARRPPPLDAADRGRPRTSSSTAVASQARGPPTGGWRRAPRAPAESLPHRGGCSAEAVLQRLAPTCAALRRGTLQHEQVRTAEDLAALGREDLRELGLTMAERGRVLRWARHAWAAPEVPEVGDGPSSDDALPPKCSSGEIGEGTPTELLLGAERLVGAERFRGAAPREEDEEAMQSRLDEVEQAGDFWCTMVQDATRTCQWQGADQREGPEVSDLREDVLEAWFDLTPENIHLLYQDMLKQGGGEVSLRELKHGLQECGMPGLSDEALNSISEKLGLEWGGRGLRRAELDVVLSRLKLAHILVFRTGADNPDEISPHQRLWVVDYNTRGADILKVRERDFKAFFFGHRPRVRPGVPALVRWVHCCGFDLMTLLALTVKYGLHPLAVEDMVEQCQTKIEQYGNHHFVVVQVLILASPTDGKEPVKVRSMHVSCSCSGVGNVFHADTLITVTQPDSSFAEDWPGGVSVDEESEMRRNFEEGGGLFGKLRQRLEAPRSKLRERKADFLMHQIIDLCADALVDVKSAFLLRLNHLEEQIFYAENEHHEDAALAEVTLVSLQLGVLARRLRGLQRLLRHAVQHPDLGADFPGYFQDVKDGVEESGGPPNGAWRPHRAVGRWGLGVAAQFWGLGLFSECTSRATRASEVPKPCADGPCGEVLGGFEVTALSVTAPCRDSKRRRWTTLRPWRRDAT
ncbi:unnamed protein product [Prorocentrum cordatum]|uniref:Uncharacterized protein n=1 Tax=Prorocentrum cordatum TaxID=2364126 RepID=A0ABN9R8W5_9DINO|nr:unnamed protein product [Polarella glacialis]